MTNNIISTINGLVLRAAKLDDMEKYYINYNPLDSELVYLTGCKRQFSENEIANFLKDCVSSNEKHLFFIISQDNNIIGETVINEIDLRNNHANFRIAIFKADYRNKGLGTWATKQTCDFAFRTLMLHRLTLEVFSFNSRAKSVYLKCGFKQEGVLREAIKCEGTYCDIILMSILAHEWTDGEQPYQLR